MNRQMKRKIIIFTVILMSVFRPAFGGDKNEENGISQQSHDVEPVSRTGRNNASKEDLYKKIIKTLMQENADLKANLSKLKDFNAQLEKKAKTFYLKARDNEQVRNGCAGFNKLLEKLNKENAALKKENDNLARRFGALAELSRKEKAGLNQELGAAYTKAKLFPHAIEAYVKSLSLNPDNAEPHYNLGLLYQRSEEDTKKSLYHFKKYLQIKPNAKNKKEVKYLLSVLTESLKQKIE